MFKNILKKSFSTKNPFQSTAHKSLKLGSNTFNYYDMNTLGDICKLNLLIFKLICLFQLESYSNPL